VLRQTVGLEPGGAGGGGGGGFGGSGGGGALGDAVGSWASASEQPWYPSGKLSVYQLGIFGMYLYDKSARRHK
jgi:hypothetical protein